MNTPGSSHETVTRYPQGVDRLPSGAFRARVAVDGRQTSLGTFPNVTAAARAAEKARTDVRAGAWLDPRRSTITLDAWMVEWMPNRPIRASTRDKDQERYDKHIKPWLGSLPLARITPYQIQKWLTQLPANPPTVKKAHTLLKTALGVRGAIGDQRLHVNPCTIVTVPTPQRPDWTLLTRPQIDLILEHTPQRWQPLVVVLADTGLRWSEAMGLQRQDFNPLRRTLHVARARDRDGQPQPTKNRRDRTIPLSSRALQALNTAATGDSWIFTAPRGGPLSASNWTFRTWKPACRAAGVTARIHDLRHSYASHLLATGADLAAVRDLLGHSSVTVTELYLHTTPDTLADTVQRAFG